MADIPGTAITNRVTEKGIMGQCRTRAGPSTSRPAMTDPHMDMLGTAIAEASITAGITAWNRRGSGSGPFTPQRGMTRISFLGMGCFTASGNMAHLRASQLAGRKVTPQEMREDKRG
jgi:hypothetical protein